MNVPVLIGLISGMVLGNNSLAVYLNRPVIAVMDFEPGKVPEKDTVLLADFTRRGLKKDGKYTVIEKSAVEERLSEVGFDKIVCSAARCAVKIGRILNSDHMIVGGVEGQDGEYTVSLEAVDVYTGAVFLTGKGREKTLSGLKNTLSLFIDDLVSGKTDLLEEQRLNNERLLNSLKREKKSGSINYLIGAGMLLAGTYFTVASSEDITLLVPGGICSAVGVFAVVRTMFDRRRIDREINDRSKNISLMMDIDFINGELKLFCSVPFRETSRGQTKTCAVGTMSRDMMKSGR